MPSDITLGRTLLIMAICTFSVFITRALPFIIFSKGKVPKLVKYIGDVLPPAVIALLVVYCYKAVNVTVKPFGAPEFIAGIVTAGLHMWKRNNFLSIGVGTILYMVLIQVVF